MVKMIFADSDIVIFCEHTTDNMNIHIEKLSDIELSYFNIFDYYGQK